MEIDSEKFIDYRDKSKFNKSSDELIFYKRKVENNAINSSNPEDVLAQNHEVPFMTRHATKIIFQDNIIIFDWSWPSIPNCTITTKK